MKRIYKVSYILAALFIMSSCQGLFEDDLISSNPNAVTVDDVPVGTLLSGTLTGLAKLHEDTDTRIAYMWSGQMTGATRQHLALSQYIVSSATFSWEDYYAVGGMARIVQAKADKIGDTWHKGIAQIAEALIIAKTTDFWGDIPYSQAYDIETYPQPEFDTQQQVYNALLATLDEAILNLSAVSGSSPSGADFIYKGSVTKWVAAAYTMKARLYLHLGDYDKAIENALEGISSPDADALIPHGSAQTIDQNLNYSFFVNTRSGDTNFNSPAVLPSLMAANDFKRNAKTDETALYNHFFQYGKNTGDNNILDANTGAGAFFAQDASHPILTFYENQLILAESYARTNQPALAIEALNSVRQVLGTGYINGTVISAAYQEMGILYDDYVEADFATQSDLIYEIVLTKYIVTLSQYESFNDVRRLAIATPVVTLPVTPIVGTRTSELPGRYVYPLNEIVSNTNLLESEVSDQFEKLWIFK